jgi:glycosyltransferase involved in cell wall biosynthesis
MAAISVIIPTYKRPALLPRAIESVLKQSFTDWNLFISDDEEPMGEVWQYLTQLAASDPRIHVLRNTARHSQVSNMNNLFRHADGMWIKPLFDDDVLRPHCLEVFARAVARCDNVIMAGCCVAHYTNNVFVKSDSVAGQPLLELVSTRYTNLGGYLQDDVGGGIPTQMMVHRRAIEQGVLFEDHPGLISGVDVPWNIRLRQLGDSLIINLPLVELHQGEHETVTSQIGHEQLDRELEILLELQRPMIDPSLRPPSVTAVRHMLRVIRAFHRLAKRQPLAALRLSLGTWYPVGWKLGLQWLLRKKFPNRFHNVPRSYPDARGLLDGLDLSA